MPTVSLIHQKGLQNTLNELYGRFRSRALCDVYRYLISHEKPDYKQVVTPYTAQMGLKAQKDMHEEGRFSKCDKHLWYKISQEKLGEILHYSRSTIQKAIRQLIEAGYLIARQFRKKCGDLTYFYRWSKTTLKKFLNLEINEGQTQVPERLSCRPLYNGYAIYNKLYKLSKDNLITYITAIRKSVFRDDKRWVRAMDEVKWDKRYLEMAKVWNTVLGHKTKFVLAPHIEDRCLHVLSEKFNNNMAAWEEYCLLISSSVFMMSPEWSLNLGYILQFEIVDRILGGGLGVKLKSVANHLERQEKKVYGQKQASSSCLLISKEEVIAKIDSLSVCDEEKSLRKRLVGRLGHDVYISWLHALEFSKGASGFKFTCPNEFFRDYFLNNWEIILKEEGLEV